MERLSMGLTKCLTQKVPAINGQCTAQIDLSVTQHTEVFEGVCLRELCAPPKKGKQTASKPGVEAHNLRRLSVYCH
jgi:hypothetical protein